MNDRLKAKAWNERLKAFSAVLGNGGLALIVAGIASLYQGVSFEALRWILWGAVPMICSLVIFDSMKDEG